MKKIVSPFTVTAEKLSSGEQITIAPMSLKTEKHLSFTCDISKLGDGKILVGHGYEMSSASWIEITDKEIFAYAYYTYTDPKKKVLLKGLMVWLSELIAAHVVIY